MKHGHVRPNPDRILARCGGPKLCTQCRMEQALVDIVQTGEQGNPAWMVARAQEALG